MPRFAPTTFLALALASVARAADHPVAGDALVLRDPLAENARRLRFVARRDGAVDAHRLSDPRTAGATLEVAGSGFGDGASGAIPLDAAHWRGLGRPAGSRGWRYSDPARSSGVRTVVVRGGPRGTIVVTGGGPAWPYRVAQPQAAIDVRLSIGDDVWCAEFDAFARNRPGRVVARPAPAPPDCRPGSSAVCGDGVATGREECDDGNTTSGDGCSATCTLEDVSALCAGVPATSGTALRLRRVATGLAQPLHATAGRLDPTRVFVVEQPGRIRIVERGRLVAAPFLDLRGKLVSGGERGLLSVAFHPDFEQNGLFYVNYTRAGDGATVVARYHADPDASTADPASEHVLFTIPQPFANHNGGLNAFGPDGFLYVGMGDGGDAGDPMNNAQDDGSRLGKLLRVDLATETPVAFAKGLRNPWRYSFDRATGDLYIADVGQDRWEEVDVQPAPLVPGVNYGWRRMEGRHCFDPATGCDPGGLTPPVLEYCHPENGATACAGHPRGCSITGGFVYRGCRMPDLRGRYFYGDFCSSFIRSFAGVAGGDAQDVRDHTRELTPSGRAIRAISSFGEDARGELYLVDYGSKDAADGQLLIIEPR
jgi:cysteine-rich repeat protein